MKKNILIIGAGYGGILTAKKLEKRFRKNDNVNITIIDKNPFHTMLTELHEVAAGRVDEDSIKVSLKRVFAGRRVNTVLDTVTDIDFDNKTVKGNARSYEYDYLVIAAGSKPTFYGVPGAEEFAFMLWSYHDAVKLRERILNMFRKAALQTDTEEKKRLLTFHIIGAGFTGVELAGELAEYVAILCDKYEIPREMVSINIADVLSRPVPGLTERLSAKVEKRLRKMGVDINMNTNVVKIGEDFIETQKNGTTEHFSTGTVVWAAGIEASDITEKAANTLTSSRRGRIHVDSYLRSVDRDNVFVVGDNMMYIAPGKKGPVPQMVENCEQSSAVAANNIYSAITEKGNMKEYKPAFHGVMVSIGSRYGVARVGLPNRMFSLPSFLAMFTKHFINIVYFIQLLGWNKVFSYLKHEFFTIRNRRSFVGGHFSNRTPSFLLVPLRIWLGAVWLFEGIVKIIGGWFTSAKLTTFFGGADAWFNNILTGGAGGASAATPATDAASGATGAVIEAASAGTTIFNYKILGFFDAIFVSAKDLSDVKQQAELTLGDLAFKLDIPFVDWVVDNIVLSSDGMQIFMQGFIVIAEILIGLALIAGLFTMPASAFSLVLQFMFVCTTGLYLGTFWMIFAAIAVLIGGGRIFGLDYYVMPFLKNIWKRLPFVRKWYIYND